MLYYEQMINDKNIALKDTYQEDNEDEEDENLNKKIEDINTKIHGPAIDLMDLINKN